MNINTIANLFDLTGKNAIVTGSTSGIGRAIISCLAEVGAYISVALTILWDWPRYWQFKAR